MSQGNKLFRIVKVKGQFVFHGYYQDVNDTHFIVPNHVQVIGNRAFLGCALLKEISLPNSLTEIGELAFCDCTALTEITIPNSVKKIGDDAFMGCTSLREIRLPDSVEEIGNYAFKGCTSLKSVTLPSSITRIDKSTFNGCVALSECSIPHTVERIEGGTFRGVERFIRVYRTDVNVSNVSFQHFERSSPNIKDSYLIAYPDPYDPIKLKEVPCSLELSLNGSNMIDLIKDLDKQFRGGKVELKPHIALLRFRLNYVYWDSLRNDYLLYLKSRLPIVIRDLFKREDVEALYLLFDHDIINKDNIDELIDRFLNEAGVEMRVQLLNIKYRLHGEQVSIKFEL